MCKTLLSDLAHPRKISKRINQIQQSRIGRAKLTLERVGRCIKQFHDTLRILMQARRRHNEADAIFAAPARAPGHLLQLGGGQCLTAAGAASIGTS